MALEQNWFVLNGQQEHGPFSARQLKQLAESGQINPDSNIRLGNTGGWKSAARVRGLFDSVAQRTDSLPAPSSWQAQVTEPPKISSSPARPALIPQVVAMAPSHSLNSTQIQDRTPCVYCGELIAVSAIKCRHCNEFLDGRPRANQQQPQQILMQSPFTATAPPAQHVNVVVNQSVGNSLPLRQRWSPGVAMVLSFIIPGLGQLYKGQMLNGLAWFIFTIIGYAAFIFPGLVLHLCCIIGAGRGDPYR